MLNSLWSELAEIGPLNTRIRMLTSAPIGSLLLSHKWLISRMASRCRRAYILPLWFLLSLFWRLISEITECISTKLGHIFTYDCYLKNCVRTPRAFTPTAGGKNRILEPTLNFDRTHLFNRHMISTIEKKLVSWQGLPYMLPIFGDLLSRSGWEWLASLCPPPKFSHWETLPAFPHGRYITDSRQTLARVM